MPRCIDAHRPTYLPLLLLPLLLLLLLLVLLLLLLLLLLCRSLFSFFLLAHGRIGGFAPIRLPIGVTAKS